MKQDITRSNSVFVLCGIDFGRLEFHLENINSPALHRIWLTDHCQPAYRQKTIQVAAQIEPFHHLEAIGTAGSLVCVSRTELIVAALDNQGGPKIVPRRILVGGTPTRLIFSKHLNRLVIGFTHHELRVSSHGNGYSRSTEKRSLRPSIRIVDPNEDSPKDENEDCSSNMMRPAQNVESSLPIGKAGERILGMLGSRVPALHVENVSRAVTNKH